MAVQHRGRNARQKSKNTPMFRQGRRLVKRAAVRLMAIEDFVDRNSSVGLPTLGMWCWPRGLLSHQNRAAVARSTSGPTVLSAWSAYYRGMVDRQATPCSASRAKWRGKQSLAMARGSSGLNSGAGDICTD